MLFPSRNIEEKFRDRIGKKTDVEKPAAVCSRLGRKLSNKAAMRNAAAVWSRIGQKVLGKNATRVETKTKRSTRGRSGNKR